MRVERLQLGWDRPFPRTGGAPTAPRQTRRATRWSQAGARRRLGDARARPAVPRRPARGREDDRRARGRRAHGDAALPQPPQHRPRAALLRLRHAGVRAARRGLPAAHLRGGGGERAAGADLHVRVGVRRPARRRVGGAVRGDLPAARRARHVRGARGVAGGAAAAQRDGVPARGEAVEARPRRLAARAARGGRALAARLARRPRRAPRLAPPRHDEPLRRRGGRADRRALRAPARGPSPTRRRLGVRRPAPHDHGPPR